MKQVIINKGIVSVEDVPSPSVQPNSILVETVFSLISTGTEVAGINKSGTPLWQRALNEPEKVRQVLDMARISGVANTIERISSKLNEGFTPGYSCSGLVIGVGGAVRAIKIGDRVACAGGGIASHAEIVSVPNNLFVKVPDNVELQDAASVALGAIALQGVRQAGIHLGETVVVIGLGLVGLLTVQLLKAAGCRVIGVDPIASRVHLAKSHGLDIGVSELQKDGLCELSGVMPLEGADATIITASSKSSKLVQQAMEITRKKGTVVIVGDIGLSLERSPFYEKEIDLRISCSYGPGRYDDNYEMHGVDYPYPYVRWTERRNMQEYLHMLSEGKVKFACLVAGNYPQNKADEAYRALNSGEERPIAVLLTYAVADYEKKDKLKKTVSLTSLARKKQGLINVAVIGVGSFAKSYHLPNLKKLSHIYNIEAICSHTSRNAKEAARLSGAHYCTTDYHEVLGDNNIDMALIATRHDLHAATAMDAARAGKAVFLEKPMALNSQELNELVKVLEDTRVPFMVGFNRRFSPYATKAREIVKGRKNPLIITYRVNAGNMPPDEWVYSSEGGGRIIGEACHMIDLLNFLVGSPLDDVAARAIVSKNPNIQETDNFSATFRYDDGSIAALTYTSLGAAEAGKEYIEIFSDGKTLIINDFKELSVFGCKNHGLRSRTVCKGHREELEQFGRYLNGQGSLPVPLEQLISATETSFLIDATARGLHQPRPPDGSIS